MEPQLETNKPKQEEPRTVPPLVASAPSRHSLYHHTLHPSNDIEPIRPVSTENKYKLTITSERFAQLRKIAEEAVREHRTFTIKGGWQTLRNQLLQRNWVEKNEYTKPQKITNLQASIDDVCVNLPSKQDWETATAHKDKCEKTIMSRLLNMHEVDFYWNMRKDTADWHHRCSALKTMNRFNRSLFTSKEGLCLLLQQMYWHSEPGIAYVNFPRCYVLGFPDHYNNFVDDFRITASMCLLKWYTDKIDTTDEYSIISPEGNVPFSALHFAIARCNDYIATQKHLDIDNEFVKVWDHEWDQFLSHYYQIVHKDSRFIESREHNPKILNATAKLTLREMMRVCPQYHLDGMKNIWILKPGNKCRGRGIQLIRTVEDVTKVMSLKLKYVVQKYIEKPLIIYQTKFDIRQWFMVTCVQPLTIWMYRESYLRFSSQYFSLDDFHESLHLTNHAVQCKYTNVNQRDKALPEENMWDCHTFKSYLKQIGQLNKWDEVIYPGMRECIIGTMLACQETMDRRPNTFEIYGADFILAEDFKPWLLEINSSPDLSSSTSVTARMCPQCLEDVIKVIIDRRRDPKADTGMFELVYKQNMPRAPAYLGMSLCVRGRKLFKNKKTKTKPEEEPKKKPKKERDTEIIIKNADILPKYVTTIMSPNIYKGPVIHDLIEEINCLYDSNDNEGVNFVSPINPPPNKKKNTGIKNDRVSKRTNRLKNITNDKTFVNRKSSASESKPVISGDQKNRKRLVKSNYISMLSEWHNRANENNLEKNIDFWERDTSSILKGKNILTKLNFDNLETSINKCDKSPKCLSPLSWRSILPNLNNNSAVNVNRNFLTVGTGLQSSKNASGDENTA